MAILDYAKFIGKYGEGKKYGAIDEEQLNSLEVAVPDQIMRFWLDEGISGFMDGFLWTIDPSQYIDWLNDWLQFDERCVPFARTVFGDIFFLKGERIGFLHVNKGLVEYVTPRIDWFFNRFLCDDKYVDQYFERSLYNQVPDANKTVGPDQCLGFEPILSLGGSGEVESLKKVGLKEYLHILSQANGEVDFVEV